MTKTTLVHAYRPVPPATRTFYLTLRRSDPIFWSPGYTFHSTEADAMEEGIRAMNNSDWPALDYRVIAVELPINPAPEPKL